MAPTQLRCGDLSISLASPLVMAIVNVTPDSFSDGGSYHSAQGQLQLTAVLNRVEAMLQEGADIIDVGGESTRPGAIPVSLEDELARVIPVIEAIRKRFDVVVSVDTSRPEVISQAADAGAGIINDVRALELPGALAAAANTSLPVCLMHMRGSPQTMQANTEYDDCLNEVHAYLAGRQRAALDASIAGDNILLDPGFGFGKTEQHNLALINQLYRFHDLECPLLVGVSRKSTIGTILNKPVEERLVGSLVLAYESLRQGAKILRVHDVGPTVDMVKMYNALDQNRGS
ncbi:dihydropteroate synthase [Halioxenophilus aromaticivorans]|uniref:Dihydropteroate synthase n=1 Tax=Halioxenophilus aromaticivorans TaxID=1306992 RepID=A0AAV3U8V5_9ALTE